MITLTNGVQVPENAVQLQTTAAIDGYYVTQPLRLVQYDETLPVAAVQLTYQSQPYIPPTGAELNVRMGKPDGKGVYNPCLGMDSSGIVYFAFTQQMTIVAGTGTLTVEITDSGVKNSAPIIAEIRPNPVPEGSIESADEFLTLQEILQQAEQWGQIVQTNASNIQQVVDNLADIQSAAENAQQAAASAAAAQQAAQEALGFRKFYSAVVPDANGNLDPSRPMTVGPAASVEIESAGDRIQSVTALGFTQQAGTGDPSPSNVRAITNVGLKLVKLVLNGTEGWILNPGSGTAASGSRRFQLGMSVTSSNASASVAAVAYCSHFDGTTPSNTYGSNYDNAFSVQNTDLQLRVAGISTVDGLKRFLAACYAASNPLIVWYQPADESQATGLYAPIILTSGEYRATCLPLTAPLCEGDSAVSWAKSGCDQQLTLDGSTLTVAASGSNYTVVAANAVAGGTVYASGLAGLSLTTGSITIPSTAFPASVTNAGQANTWLQSNPQMLYYQSTAYTESDDIAVSLETHQQAVLVLDGTEPFVTNNTGSWTDEYAQFFAAGVAQKPGSSGICNQGLYQTMNSANKSMVNVNASGGVSLRMPKANVGETAESCKAYLAAQYAAGTPVTIVYQLATPITYAHPAVVIEAATGNQLTYIVTGRAGGQVSVAIKPSQDGGHAKTANNATQFDGHTWDEVSGQAPVQSVNRKTGAVTLTAADVGAVPLNHTAVLADGITLKDGSPVNTPADIDQYTVLRIYSNYGAAVCSVPAKGSQTGFLSFINGTSAPNINIVVVNISRTETQLTLETNATLRLATTGITAPSTALSVYRIEGLV